MYKRYYDGYHSGRTVDKDKGEIITPKCADDTYRQKDECEKKDICEEKEICCTAQDSCPANCNRFMLPGELDDIILAGILLLLLWDSDSFDPILLVIVGFVLFADVL